MVTQCSSHFSLGLNDTEGKSTLEKHPNVKLISYQIYKYYLYLVTGLNLVTQTSSHCSFWMVQGTCLVLWTHSLVHFFFNSHLVMKVVMSVQTLEQTFSGVQRGVGSPQRVWVGPQAGQRSGHWQRWQRPRWQGQRFSFC